MPFLSPTTSMDCVWAVAEHAETNPARYVVERIWIPDASVRAVYYPRLSETRRQWMIHQAETACEEYTLSVMAMSPSSRFRSSESTTIAPFAGVRSVA